MYPVPCVSFPQCNAVLQSPCPSHDALLYPVLLQSHGAVPAAPQQVPPVFGGDTPTTAVHLHQVCQLIPRDKATNTAGKLGRGGRVGGLEHWTGNRVVLSSNHAAATLLRNFGNSVYPALPVSFGGDNKSRRSLLSGV